MASANTNRKKKKSGGNLLFAKGAIDIPFFLILMTIVTVGLIMLFSSSYTYSYYFRDSSTTIFINQLIFTLLGLAAMYAISRIRYEYFRLFAIIGAAVSLALLVIVLILPEYKPGFKRWINLGFTTFQPSEIAKIAVILLFAYMLEKHHRYITGRVPSDMALARTVERLTNGRIVIFKSLTTVLMYGAVLLTFAGLIYMENHLSGAILVLAIGIVMMFLGEVKYRWFVVAGSLILVAGIILIANPGILEAYAGKRITLWLDKDAEPTGGRWQTNNSLYAIGSGGLLGTGLGQSKQKHLYVSEPQNDFIFAIVCEEVGFIGASAIIILFALLVYRGIQIAMKSKDRFAALLCMGIVFQVGIQVALNIAVVGDFIPNTGISLPFFSSGGTSIVIQLCEMGMLLSVSRSVRKKE